MMCDQDCYEFLVTSLFGYYNDPFLAASRLAYRDFCRTLRPGKGKYESGKYPKDVLVNNRNAIDVMLAARIKDLLSKNPMTQEMFDTWHHSLCMEIVNYYQSSMAIGFSVGQAQKWVNMTMKYLYIQNEIDIGNVTEFLHIPLDNYIIAEVKSSFNIDPPSTVWSKMDDYVKYLEYEIRIRNKLKDIGIIPIKWEMKAWLNSAKALRMNGNVK